MRISENDKNLLISNEDLENFVAKKGDILFRLSFPIKVIEVDEEIEKDNYKSYNRRGSNIN